MSKFPKQERLNSKKRFGELISAGNSLYIYPFRLLWITSPADSFHLQVAFSVPKRKYKRAVDRNRIKRKMREAFRLEKESLKEEMKSNQTELCMLLIYIGKKEEEWQEFQKSMQEMLIRLKKSIDEQTP